MSAEDLSTRVEERLARGREIRLALVEALSDMDPPPMRRQVIDGLGASKGFVSGGARWVENKLEGDWQAGLDALSAGTAQLDAAVAVLFESIERAGNLNAWRTPTPPLVLRTGRDGRLRAGVFVWSTDRDAFLSELLGQVPRRPRYVYRAPALPPRIDALEDVQEAFDLGIDEADELYRISRGAALRSPTFANVIHRNLEGRVGGPLASYMLSTEGDLSGFPLAEFLHPLVRAAPNWRRPKAHLDSVAVIDLGVLGVVGYAQWNPGMAELRPYRRPLAGYLRYLFDYFVAPWGRFGDERRAHEAFLLYFRSRWIPERLEGRPDTIKALAAHWRKMWPEDYRTEPEAVTLRRLYRINSALQVTPTK